MLKRISQNKIALIAVTAITFIAVTLPFRYFFSVIEVTEVRPAAAFNPAFGIFFGPYAAFGCAIGNFIADLISGYGITLSSVGFPVQFLYGYLPYILYNRYTRNKRKPLSVDNTGKMLSYAKAVIISSVFTAFILGIFVVVFGYGDFVSNFIFMFFNNIDFCILLGLPIIIILNYSSEKEKNPEYVLSLNEEITVFILVIAIVIMLFALTGVFYLHNFDFSDKHAIWSDALYEIAVYVNLYFVVAFIYISNLEKKILSPLKKLSAIMRNNYKSISETENQMEIVSACNDLADNKSEVGNLARAYLYIFERLQNQLAIGNENTELIETETNKNFISANFSESTLCVSISGKLDKETSKMLLSEFGKYSEQTKNISLDFSNLNYISSDGMKTLMEIQKQLGKEGSMEINNANNLVKTILKMIGFNGNTGDKEKC